jgi:hypothetical protein
VPIELMKKLIAKLNLVELTNAYGMSEYFFSDMENHPNLLLCMQPRQGTPQLTRVTI